MFFMLLIHMSNFVSIGYYLLYILCIILNYKNLQFKQFIDDMAIDFEFFINFSSMEYIRRRHNLMIDLSKFASNKKILSKVVALDCNQFCI